MPKAFTMEYEDGRTEDFFGSSGYCYITDDGMLPFYPIPAWCSQCNCMTLAEDLPNEEELTDQERRLTAAISDQSLSNSQYFAKHRRNKPKLESLMHEQREIALRRKFLDCRKTPGKCLTCGTSFVHFFKLEAYEPHPQTGEIVRFTWNGMCTNFHTRKCFDTEGNTIPQSELPS